MKSCSFPKCQDALESIRAEHGLIEQKAMRDFSTLAAHELFQVLRLWPLQEIPNKGRQFTPHQRVILKNHLDLAPDTLTLFKVAVLFFWHESKAFERVIQVLLYGKHSVAFLEPCFEWIQSHPDCGQFLKGWILEWSKQRDVCMPENFVLDRLMQGHLGVTAFLVQAPEKNSYLAERTLDILFESEQRILLEALSFEWTHWCGERYLNSSDWKKLGLFFTMTQPSQWTRDFLESVYARMGPPDPAVSEGYRAFPTETLWAFRKRLFSNRIPVIDLQEMRKSFWLNWLHRCSDVNMVRGVLHLRFRDMWIEEHPDVSLIKFADPRADDLRLTFTVDWEMKMNRILMEASI